MLVKSFFFTKKSDEQLIVSFVLEKFGYKVRSVKFFKEAFTHKSSINHDQLTSNERLEFLGDSIIDTVIAKILYLKFPNEDEGFLTRLKSKLVSRISLAIIADKIEISRILKYNKNLSINLETIQGNAFEAVIGAIFLDGGYKSVEKSLKEYILKKHIDISEVLIKEVDFKSRLFIWSQKNQTPFHFEVLSEIKKKTSWQYIIVVKINNKEYGLGVGPSKKKAEQQACQNTLVLLNQL
ncbi:MAG: ribonuclease III [Crocinitomicaceae bacterium]|nr:ribonuclease III [Crocinitomicaceae bacterium]